MAIIPNECKFHVVSESVDTVDRGSKLAQSKRESITMADIAETVGGGGPFEYGSGGDTSIVSKQGNNTATQTFAAAIGGTNNDVIKPKSQIFGGERNYLNALGDDNTIVGGCSNQINGGGSGSNYGGHLITGGFDNTIELGSTQNCAPHAIIGGKENEINLTSTEYSNYMYVGSQIIGGYQNCINTAYGGAQGSTILGGYYSEIVKTVDDALYRGVNLSIQSYGSCIVDSDYSSVINSRGSCITRGENNLIIGSQFSSTTTSGVGLENTVSFIVGGASNTINAASAYSGMIGGVLNTIYGDISRGVIVGGYFNDMNVPTNDSAIIGGRNNVVSNDRSVVVGGQAVATDRDNTLFCENLSIKGVPTSSAGLPSGSVWSNSGVLNIVA